MGPKYSMSGSKGKAGAKDHMPGPAEYHADFQAKRPASAKIGTAKRGDLCAAMDSPGPGHYNANPCDIPGPAWGFSKMLKGSAKKVKSAFQIEDTGPGPGHYNIPSLVGEEPGYVYRSKDSSKKP